MPYIGSHTSKGSSSNSFTVTEETLTADRTLTEADAGTWFFETTANRVVFLPETPTRYVEFDITYVGTTSNVYLEIKCIGDTGFFTRLYSGAATKVIFDVVTGKWTLHSYGSRVVRTATGTYATDTSTSCGSSANGSTYGTAIGYFANGSTYGTAIGRNTDGSVHGAAIGRNSNGSSYGTAIGYFANGSTYGTAIGRNANGPTYGTAVGYFANAASQYGSAIGAYSKQERYGGHARSGDHLPISKLHVEEVYWKGTTTDATATELFLHGVSATYCTLLASSVLGFTVRVTGITDATFEVIDLEFKGTIKRDDSNVVTLVGAVTSTVINNDLVDATAALTVNDTTKALKLTVTGLDGKTIHWGAVGLLLDRRI